MSEMEKDYLSDIQVHNFDEGMSLFECAMETCLLAESNWAYIVESTALAEYESTNSCLSVCKYLSYKLS